MLLLHSLSAKEGEQLDPALLRGAKMNVQLRQGFAVPFRFPSRIKSINKIGWAESTQ